MEHPFLKVKRRFGYTKVRYRGLAKNMERLALLFGLGNLLTAEGHNWRRSAHNCGTTPVSGPHQASNNPVTGETQGAECWTASPGPQFSLPFSAPSNTTQAKTALFRGFLNETARSSALLIFAGVLEFICQKPTSIIATGSAVASSTFSKLKAKLGDWMEASGN